MQAISLDALHVKVPTLDVCPVRLSAISFSHQQTMTQTGVFQDTRCREQEYHHRSVEGILFESAEAGRSREDLGNVERLDTLNRPPLVCQTVTKLATLYLKRMKGCTQRMRRLRSA